MTPYLNSSTPICLSTIQLSWGYDDDSIKDSLQMNITIVKAFWRKILSYQKLVIMRFFGGSGVEM